MPRARPKCTYLYEDLPILCVHGSMLADGELHVGPRCVCMVGSICSHGWLWWKGSSRRKEATKVFRRRGAVARASAERVRSHVGLGQTVSTFGRLQAFLLLLTLHAGSWVETFAESLLRTVESLCWPR
jgi:hypothetical protein